MLRWRGFWHSRGFPFFINLFWRLLRRDTALQDRLYLRIRPFHGQSILCRYRSLHLPLPKSLHCQNHEYYDGHQWRLYADLYDLRQLRHIQRVRHTLSR